MIFEMWMGDFKPSSQVTKRETQGMEVRSRVSKMPERDAGIMPNFRQSGIDQPPSQVIRSADKTTVRRVFIETAKADRVIPSHRYTGANVWPQFFPLKCSEV